MPAIPADDDAVSVTDVRDRLVEVVQGLRTRASDGGRRRPNIYGSGPVGGDPGDTLGAAFVGSEAYRGWMERFPGGGPGQRIDAISEASPLPLRLADGRRTALRAIVSADDAVAGSLVAPDRAPLEDLGRRPAVVRDLVTIMPTTSDLIEFPRKLPRSAQAEMVAEATAATGTSGTKPEADLSFELVEVRVHTIAVHLPVTKQVLADATLLRAFIDTELIADVDEVLDVEMIVGGGGPNAFVGILNTPGIGGPVTAGAGEGPIDVIRKGRTLVQTNGRTTPTAVLVNPDDSEAIDLLKVNAEVNHYARDPFGSAATPLLYGMRIVESESVPAGTGLIGDFRKAVLFDREDASVSVGTIGDDFIRNIVRILAEGRWGFVVSRPSAFAELTF
jgi:HK97 family phage major capsid protein